MRIFAERSPVPTCDFRICDRFASASATRRSSNRARSTSIPLSLFWSCDFWSCWLTTSPVGRCVMRTAESVVFTLWPPGPLERKTSMRRSLSSILTSTSSASGSTATVAADVWMRPCVSVAGTRCTRCTPDSQRIAPNAPAPETLNTASFTPPSVPSECEIVSRRQPARSMNRVYMRKRSAANSAASSPPVPARISMIALRSSSGSCGSSAGLSRTSRSAICASSRVTSAVASAAISGSSTTRTSSRASASSFSAFSSWAASSMTGWRRRCSRPSSATFVESAKVSGLLSNRSTSAAWARVSPRRSRRLTER